MKKSMTLIALLLLAGGRISAQENQGSLDGSEELPVMSFLLPEPGAGPLGDDPMGTDTPDPFVPVPVDGGLSLLLAAGAAMGVRRLRRNSGRKD